MELPRLQRTIPQTVHNGTISVKTDTARRHSFSQLLILRREILQPRRNLPHRITQQFTTQTTSLRELFEHSRSHPLSHRRKAQTNTAPRPHRQLLDNNIVNTALHAYRSEISLGQRPQYILNDT